MAENGKDFTSTNDKSQGWTGKVAGFFLHSYAENDETAYTVHNSIDNSKNKNYDNRFFWESRPHSLFIHINLYFVYFESISSSP